MSGIANYSSVDPSLRLSGRCCRTAFSLCTIESVSKTCFLRNVFLSTGATIALKTNSPRDHDNKKGKLIEVQVRYHVSHI